MPERRTLSTTVTDVGWLTPSMVRVVVGGPDLEGFAVGSFTDHYVKCRFGDRMRSYTVRAFDPERRLLTLDFVVHGDRGIAGPWAAQARPGMVEDPARLLEYLVDRMLTGYEQDDDVTVLVLHVPERDGQPPAPRPRAAGVMRKGRA